MRRAGSFQCSSAAIAGSVSSSEAAAIVVHAVSWSSGIPEARSFQGRRGETCVGSYGLGCDVEDDMRVNTITAKGMATAGRVLLRATRLAA